MHRKGSPGLSPTDGIQNHAPNWDAFPHGLFANRSTPERRNDTLCADRLGVHVAESNHHPEQEAQKRRTTRIVQAVPLTVTGVDALGRPFQERTSTLIINCHGARYQSKHYVLKNMWVTLEVPHNEAGREARSVRGRVTWIQRPRTVRELFQIGVELEVSGNVWGIAFPPADWFPFPESGAVPNLEIPAPVGNSAACTRGEDWSSPEEVPAARAAGPEPDGGQRSRASFAGRRPIPPCSSRGKWPGWLPRQSSTFRVRSARAPLNAVAAETRPLLAALQTQLKDAAEKSVAAAVTAQIEKSQQESRAAHGERAGNGHGGHARAIVQRIGPAAQPGPGAD